MVKAIEQIRSDLSLITERVTTVQESLEQVYGDYLNAFGVSLKRQLVLAGYQLCTQIYPQLFLKLSYSQRQTIQQDLRHLGEQASGQLQEVLTATDPEEPEETPELELTVETEASLEQELLEVFETIDQAMEDEYEGDDEEESQQKSTDGDRESKERRNELAKLAERIAESIAEMMHTSEEETIIEADSPEQLIEWCKTREKRIRSVLNKVSQQANRQLQKAHILPEHIPSEVIDMAILADNQQNSGQSPSNLVSLTIEADLGQKKKQRTRITVIHLKVSEIEFCDSTVSGQRKRIYEQIGKIKQLKKYYTKSKRDLAIAEAESAWRSSWHEGELKT